jgi:hypothetical protein
MQRFNGWQRLWVLGSVLYAIVIISVASFTFPTGSDVETRRSAELQEAKQHKVYVHGRGRITVEQAEGILKRAEQLSASERQELLGIDPPLIPENSSPGSFGYDLERFRELRALAEKHGGTEVDPDNQGTRIILAPDGQYAEVFNARTAEKRRQLINAKYDAELGTLGERRRNFVGWAVAAWIGPLMALYAFGWSVGWVIRGFRIRENGAEKGGHRDRMI